MHGAALSESKIGLAHRERQASGRPTAKRRDLCRSGDRDLPRLENLQER
jgi:hypothetical protein